MFDKPTNLYGVNALPCADPRCAHPFGHHKKADNVKDRGRCQRVSRSGYTIGHSSRCACQAFVWEEYEEDPDALKDDYKAGYVDAASNYLEPPWSEEP